MEPVVAVVVIVTLAATAIVFVRKRVQPQRRMLAPEIIESGWQLMLPSTGNSPGTIFRIDRDGRRFPVRILDVTTTVTHEESGRQSRAVTARMSLLANVMARHLGVSADADATTTLELELTDTELESTLDETVDRTIAGALPELEVRAGSRYFVVRATRSAMAIRYRLTREQHQRFGADASVVPGLEAEGTLHASDGSDSYDLNKTFDRRMRVMFLAEEMTLPSTPRTGEIVSRATVVEPLRWRDPVVARNDDLDFLVFALVKPTIDALGRAWLDSAVGHLGPELTGLLSAVVRARSADAPTSTRGRATTELADVLAYLEDNPMAAERLSEVVRRPDAIFRTPRAESQIRIDRYYAILATALESVWLLGRPVAVPGFFNSQECVTIIDARTSSDSVHLPTQPGSEFVIGDETIWLATGSALSASVDGGGWPRVWLLRTTSTDERDAVIDKMRETFAQPAAMVPDPWALARTLEDDSSAHYVQQVGPDWVYVEGASTYDKKDGFYSIDHRFAGARTMGDGVRALLRDRWDDDETWRSVIIDA